MLEGNVGASSLWY